MPIYAIYICWDTFLVCARIYGFWAVGVGYEILIKDKMIKRKFHDIAENENIVLLRENVDTKFFYISYICNKWKSNETKDKLDKFELTEM